MGGLDWLECWSLEARGVVCKQCGVAQAMTDARQPFAHLPECSAARPAAEFPWRDLTAVLRVISRDQEPA